MKTTHFFSFAAIFATLTLALLSSCGTMGNGGSSDSPSGQQDQGGGSSSDSSGNSEPPPLPLYCDYGPLVTQSNGEVTGGCFPMGTADDEANCTLWGNVVSSCPSSSSSKNNVISSSSSVVVGTQYYDVVLGNWSTSCPNLNNYSALQNIVKPLDDFITTIRTCLINRETYNRNTNTQVANFLVTNGLSKYANDFDLEIAASPYNAAFLIYINTSNYYRVLIIGYSGLLI